MRNKKNYFFKTKIITLLLLLSLSFSQELISKSFSTTCYVQVFTEMEKINLLIKQVESSKDIQFWRNGTYYDSRKAAAHLRLKLSKAKDKIKTANDFIDKVAAQSSMSGTPYRIKFKDGKEISAKEYFVKELKKIETHK